MIANVEHLISIMVDDMKRPGVQEREGGQGGNAMPPLRKGGEGACKHIICPPHSKRVVCLFPLQNDGPSFSGSMDGLNHGLESPGWNV